MNIEKLKIFIDERGILLPIEFKELPFKPERIFYVYKVPRFMRRGCHAHYKTRQYITCLSGCIKIGLHDGEKLSEELLLPGNSILVEPLTWDYQDFLTGHDLIAVLCSMPFNEQDYIKDFDQFLKIKKEFK